MRMAAACNSETSNTTDAAGQKRMTVLICNAFAIPVIAAAPTIMVMAISVGEKVPETMRAQPSRYSQIAVINKTQKRRHGSADHLLQGERRRARATVIQSGEVCTRWRMIPWETAPTTSKAAMTARQQKIKMRKSRCKTALLLRCRLRRQPCAGSNRILGNFGDGPGVYLHR
jgi:hypothetical protein